MDQTWWVGDDNLDDDQKVIATLPPAGSHVITGPPGCGKTNLLLLRAKYYSKLKKENILVLVFTRALKEFIVTGSQQYQLPPQIVSTHIGWGLQFLRQYAVRYERTGEFESLRTGLLHKVQQVVREKGLQNIYEAIFLDEAQDYLPEEIELFRTLARDIYASADPRQKIYDGPDPLPALQNNASVHPLKYHYRLGLSICRVADSIFVGSKDEPLINNAQYKEKALKSSVDPFQRCRTADQQASEIINRLKVQLNAYPNELLGVMCPRKRERDELYEIVAKSEIGNLVVKQSDDPVYDADRPIYVSTLHSSKGLEYRATHLAYAESIQDLSHQMNLTYTAVTRTKTALTVYGLGHPPGYLLQAINSVQRQPPPPTLTDLFR